MKSRQINLPETRLVRVLTALHCDTWLITPEMHRTLCEIVEAHAAGGETETAQHVKAATMPANPAPRSFAVEGRTAIIPVEGVIGRKFSNMLQDSGVTSIDVLDRMLGAVESDDEIDSALMIFDSPGGTAMGVPEAAASVDKLRETKPVLAYVDGLCCSAAYWLASQASAIYATSSAQVGSIGAYMAILDRTRQAEMAGTRVELFRSGPHKGMGYPGTALSEEQRKMLQSSVDAIAGEFKAAVVAGRKRMDDEDMQGQSFDARQAMAKNMVDSISDYGTALRDAARLGEMNKARKQKQ